jgi:hypothetical protein
VLGPGPSGSWYSEVVPAGRIQKRSRRVVFPAPAPKTSEPTCFFVSAIRGSRKALVAGPFDTHEEALASVWAVARAAEEAGFREAVWAAWGTAGWMDEKESAPLGALNERGLWPRKEER